MSGIFAFILWILIPLLPFILFSFSKKLFGKDITYDPGHGLHGQIAKVTSYELNREKIKLNKEAIEKKYNEIQKRIIPNEPLSKYNAITFKKELEQIKTYMENVLFRTIGYFPKKEVEKDIKFIESYIDKVGLLLKD